MAVTTTEQERELLYSLISRRRSVRQFTDTPVEEPALMRVLTCAQGVNSSDGKRGAPSAHALHPLGLTVVVRRVQGVEAGSYLFDPARKSLGRIASARYPAACCLSLLPMMNGLRPRLLLSSLVPTMTWLCVILPISSPMACAVPAM